MQTSALASVTRLPTAAPRKVRNPSPAKSERLAQAAGIQRLYPPRGRQTTSQPPELVRTPELLLVMAMLRSLPIAQMRSVAMGVDAVRQKDCGDAARAASYVVAGLLLSHAEAMR